MPHWQQTLAAVSKGGRRGGPAANGPVPVLATTARLADVPVYLDGVGTAKALNTVTVRSQVDGKIMAATVAAPLERRLGEIAGVTELTSRSSLGSTRVTVQFDLARNIDGAARDVQAAINAALTDLPADLPSSPAFRKFNPAATPIMPTKSATNLSAGCS